MCWLGSAACAGERTPDVYEVAFEAAFPDRPGPVTATLTVTQPSALLRTLELTLPTDRYGTPTGDGQLERDGDRLRWSVPPEGGSLRFPVTIDSRRGEAFDARLTERWVIARLDDLFPPARARTRRGAVSQASVFLHGPDGWSFETPYGPMTKARPVSNPERRFDRPTGWLVGGDLGVRRDRIAGRRVAVAAPTGSGFRRQDALAFLRWTLPEVVAVFPDFPERLLIVGAPDDFWRGGLSGPGSVYLHADRPLISENATSTLLHELIHVAMGGAFADGDDWLSEGLAELYSLDLLRRSGTISNKRFDAALATQRRWAAERRGALRDPSRGADTAFAVVTLRAVADELAGTDTDLDAIVGELRTARPVSAERFSALVEAAVGGPSAALAHAREGALVPDEPRKESTP